MLADDAPVIRSVAREQGIRALTNVATVARVLLCVLLLADPADAAAADTAHHDDAQLVAGLPAEYIVAQMRAFASGARKSAWTGPAYLPAELVAKFAGLATDREVSEAAAYFSSRALRRPRAQVIEADRVPRIHAEAWVYVTSGGGGNEPLGVRQDRRAQYARGRADEARRRSARPEGHDRGGGVRRLGSAMKARVTCRAGSRAYLPAPSIPAWRSSSTMEVAASSGGVFAVST